MSSLKSQEDRRVYKIEPVAKPRMTRSDVWKQRPAVMRYRQFCDECRAARVAIPESGATVLFFLPMPPSWKEKKKVIMDNQPHQQKPDVDNLLKAVLDAIYENDCGVWNVHVVKRWAREGSIVIYR